MTKAKASKQRFLWVTDPWNTLDHPNDTTLRLIEEGLELGIENHWCDVKSIRLEDGKALLDSYRCGLEIPKAVPKHGIPGMDAARASEPREFTKIIYRTDPPVDHAYLHPLQVLYFGLEGRKNSEMVNSFDVLFDGNEKLEPAFLGEKFTPATCISSDYETLLRFGKKEKRAVLKPLFMAQSIGVELLEFGTSDSREDARKKIEEATQGGQRPVLLQRYLSGISEGEQRLWFLNGELLAIARKNPKRGEFKIDMDAGSFLTKTKLTTTEKRAAQAISKRLKARKVRLAAVDLIEGLATDFNFTSPGLITHMEKVLEENLALPIVQSLASSWT